MSIYHAKGGLVKNCTLAARPYLLNVVATMPAVLNLGTRTPGGTPEVFHGVRRWLAEAKVTCNGGPRKEKLCFCNTTRLTENIIFSSQH